MMHHFQRVVDGLLGSSVFILVVRKAMVHGELAALLFLEKRVKLWKSTVPRK